MKLINKLEQSKSFWFLLIISIIFFLLRFPSLLEPYWYGDEGIYEVIGQALHQGRLLYSGIWDNKPPLLYVLYAVFNGDQFSLRLLSLLVGMITTIAFFFLAKRVLQNVKTAIIATSLFAVLFATPLVEGNIANAENFMLLPIILAGLLLYQQTHKKIETAIPRPFAIQPVLLLAGLLLGIAFLFKIVAIFDFAAFFLFILFRQTQDKPKQIPQNYRGDGNIRLRTQGETTYLLIPIRHIKIKLMQISHAWQTFFLRFCTAFPFVIGFLVPLVLTACYFVLQHNFSEFLQAAFLGDISYVGYSNTLFIPQGLLIVKCYLLVLFLLLVFWKRNLLSQPQLFTVLWFGFSVFNAFFSQRPYTHYMLVLLPSFCLLTGFCLLHLPKSVRRNLFLLLIATTLALIIHFPFYIKTLSYYHNALLFLTNQQSLSDYQAFFDAKTPRDYELAFFLNSPKHRSDSVFIWGDRAQIYALSHRLPPGRFTVAYHITASSQNLKETQKALTAHPPDSLIILSEARPFPFPIGVVKKIITIPGATIYEK